MNTLLKKEFGIDVLHFKKLNGYDNFNYHVKTSSNSYIFKTYSYTQELFDLIEAETKALLFLDQDKTQAFPIPIPFINGDYTKVLELDGKATICRMLSFIEGSFIGDITPTKKTYASLGDFLARLDIKLQGFNNYTLRARKWEWDLQYLHLNKKYISDIPNAHDRNVVSYFFQQFEEIVVPVLPELRKQTIYNDANEWNILVSNENVSGLIDFGDMTYAPLINELAIAITYACYDQENPLEWAIPILESYHKTLPLEEKELKILYYLIAGRLCTSICNSAHSRKTDPDNIYATGSEKFAWSMLYKLLATSPIGAENMFRKAVGMPVPKIKSEVEEVNRRHQHISPILSLSYKKPIFMVGAAFQYMYDNHGNTILDAYNNIPHVGHSHPKVVEAGQRQMAKLNTNTRYLYDLLPTYSEKLLSKFPKSLNKVYFVNSGSAASDLAMRLAHAHTKHKKLMVMEHGYHGNTQMGIDVSDYKFNDPKGAGKKEYVLKTSIPDTYNGKYKEENAGSLYAKEAIEQISNSEEPIAAFISEPIVGCGGQVPLADGYLKEIYPAIRKQGGVCISDEVQTGFGRLGDHFWGYEAQDVIPDIVILGKPMANGHPMGAVVTTDEIAESFSKGVEFFSSFGGNPVSCAIALSVIEVIEEERLQENAKVVGDYYKSLLVALKKNHKCIGDVRGSGLFLGVEIIDEKTQNTNRKLAHHIKNELRNRNILISTDGPDDSVLKTKPPLCFTKENAKTVVDTINSVLKKRNTLFSL
nr:aminotransferase class III-fold pyridoxal phosphate-dependent enzyme [uncultured Allomuricauda sp.]